MVRRRAQLGEVVERSAEIHARAGRLKKPDTLDQLVVALLVQAPADSRARP